MNRVILLGNGFDLAHGLKTGYVDFIKWYIAKCIKAAAGRDYKDNLLKISPTMNFRGSRPTEEDEILRYVNQCYEEGFNLNKLGQAALDWDGRTYKFPYTFQPQSQILDHLIKQCAVKRWVDVEAIFYETLIQILDGPYRHPADKELQLESLNVAMTELIEQLRIYLLTLESPKPIVEYLKIFNDYVHKEDLETSLSMHGYEFFDNIPSKTMILNFNFTSTVELYLDGMDSKAKSNTDINYLHGNLTDVHNPIIFGFGDELDKNYERMEDEKTTGWFEYIKSFWYLRTQNYRNLVRFVDGDEFQIVILGHSCGLSDRTMLNMLFEHENCRSIKTYYWGNKVRNNYKDTTFEIARHFHNKALMRKRIVSMPRCERMPQYDD